jgi:hypothetical protein
MQLFGTVNIYGILLAIFALVLIGAVGYALYWFFWGKPSTNVQSSSDVATLLSIVVLVGLVLTVVLMGALATVFYFLGLSVKEQPLGLPEGSIRSLIAFSLVLIFVCLAAFLYGGVNASELTKAAEVKNISIDDVNGYKEHFVVVHQPRKKADGTPEADSGGRPLYDAIIFARRNKDADDFARQIFTTLATIFVSVISFYFGSSVTTSGVNTGQAIVQQQRTAGAITLSPAEQAQIAQELNKSPGSPGPANITPRVGEAFPATVTTLQPCPPEVTRIPALANCRYILIGNQFVLVEANTQRIIAVIDRPS